MDNRKHIIEYPNHIVCPVNFTLFFHPVTLFPGGHVIEQACADKIMESTHPFYPDNTTPIQGYVTAYSIQEVVEEFLAKHPEAKADQHEPYPIRNRRDSTHPLQTHVATTTKPAMSAKAKQEANDLRLVVNLQSKINASEINQPVYEKIPNKPTNNPQHFFAAPTITPSKPVIVLNAAQVKLRNELISDIQNLIWALGFESGPQPQEITDNFSLLIFAFFIRPDPLPFHTLKIDQGPKNECMYWVLRSTISALMRYDRSILENAKLEHAGEYDLVKTVFGGTVSINAGGYVDLATFFGTVNHQPGYLVNQLVKKAEQFLPTLAPNYSVPLTHSNSSSSQRY